jgi:Flp pilus assembly protein TadG
MRNQAQRVPTRRSFRRRRGAVIILFAMLLTVVAAVMAFSIDVGYMANVRSELQNAVDAGALAGAGALQEDASTADAAAIQYIQQNRVGNRPVSPDSIEVSAGVWNATTRTFTAGGEFPNAFRVEVVDQDQPLFFGRLLSQSLFDVQARATAVYQPRDILVVLDLSTSMNNDSELASIGSLGEAAVLDNLAEIYDDLGAPVFGNLQPDPVYIESTDTNEILAQLGLTDVDYPYPGGSWSEFVQYVRDDSTVNSAGYAKKYGYPTLMQYWLAKRPLASDTPDLWMASAQPVTAVKDSVTLLLAYIQEVQSDDLVGLAVYTHPDGGAKLEVELTRNMALVEQTSRQRQPGHYEHMTNIGAGLKVAREELIAHSRRGAFKMIVLMTDGQANLPSDNANDFLLEQAQLTADAKYPVVTISLGAGADQYIMQQVADVTGGVHFNVPGGQSVDEYEEQLKEVFRQIASHRPLKLVE